MRAHGRSTAGDPDYLWSPEAMAEDVVAFLDALSLDHVHYIGESLGGVTGMALGALWPEYLHTLTLVQTPIRLGQPLNDYCRGDFPTWTEAIRVLGPGGWATKNKNPGDPRTRWEREQWDACDTEALLRLTEATLTMEVEHFVPMISVPTLILAPGASPLTSLKDQRKLEGTIPKARIEVFEEHGHDIYLTEPRRCTERIVDFIGENTPHVADR
jgi:3-oxoadipate enol-lactonase